jgi:hypothetical protein
MGYCARPLPRHGQAGCAILRQMRFNSRYQSSGSRSGPIAPGAADYLRGSGTLAALMPTVLRLVALQNDCAGYLPAMFRQCDIVQFEGGQLVLATPSAALAAKLKQQLPKLQAQLLQRGWQIESIRLKVQVTKSLAPVVLTGPLALPDRAMTALAELGDALPASPGNDGLIAALRALVQRHREP